MGDIFIRGVDLPSKIRGSVIKECDDFIILINTSLSEECQKRAIEHELKHVKQNHFYDEEPVIINEMYACLIT